MSTLREVFSSRFATIVTMVGVAIGLGNVWRFPYMVGRYGGAAFVIFYLAIVALVGVPALMAEWTLGRRTRRGPVGAFSAAGVPGGRFLGVVFFLGVTAAAGYYTNAIGWVAHHGFAQLAGAGGLTIEAGAILPPETGFSARSFALQLLYTAGLLTAVAAVLVRGVRRGIERASRWLVPVLVVSLGLLIARAATLDGAYAGIEWFVLKFEPGDFTGAVAMAALGQVAFSLALGGTFMVVYGSYLDPDEGLIPAAWSTALADTGAGLLAGLAIFPAVFALGLEPGSGPGLIFATLPEVFGRMPGGSLLGPLFFVALAGVAFLSLVAAVEVLVAGLVDAGIAPRGRAVATVSVGVFVAAVPPMINMEIFVPWDLTFGTGFQTLGALVAVATVGWALDRGAVLGELTRGARGPAASRGGGGPPRGADPPPAPRAPDLRHGAAPLRLLHLWIRWVIPLVILGVGVWWVLSEVLGVVGGV